MTSFFYIIGFRLLLNHSPSEWFSLYKKTLTFYSQSLFHLFAMPYKVVFL